MRIAVLDVCAKSEILDRSGPPGDMIAVWLGPALPEAAFTRFDFVENPTTFPVIEDWDGFIISGSEAGVYDHRPWMSGLRSFLLNVQLAEKPIFGICFGHQIMADVYGGKAEKVDFGFAGGVQPFYFGAETANAFVAHQDQVTQIPPGAQVVASAAHCPVGALAYDFPALSVQFHPEYFRDYAHQVIVETPEDVLPADRVEWAYETLKNEVPRDIFAAETAAFFRGEREVISLLT